MEEEAEFVAELKVCQFLPDTIGVLEAESITNI